MPQKGRTILVVHDDQSVLRTLARILVKAGYDVDTARSGKEGSEKLETKSYDAAIIDDELEDMQGTNLLSRMHRVSPRILKIMLTGMPPESRVDETDRGPGISLMKPVKPETVLKILEDSLARENR